MTIKKTDLNLFTDDALWKRIKKDDREAFMALYDRYCANLYIYVIQIVSTRTRGKQLEEDAKEIIIQIFESLWASRDKLSENIHLEDHLFISAYLHAVNYINLGMPGSIHR